MSQTLFTTFPGTITADNIGEVIAFHRRFFGDTRMDGNDGGQGGGDGSGDGGQGGGQEPQRPDGVSEQEWEALGDAGKQAIVRERERANAAERALAASRARPKPPGNGGGQQNGGQGAGQGAGQQGGQNGGQGDQSGDTAAGTQGVDIAAIVQQAVQAAVKPFAEREEQREADEAANRVRTAVLKAAESRFHDATDALAGIDLTTVLDGNGQPDSTKVTEAIDELLKRKPHLGKVVDERRFGEEGAGAAPGGSARPLNDRVKETLARMQERAGVKFAEH